MKRIMNVLAVMLAGVLAGSGLALAPSASAAVVGTISVSPPSGPSGQIFTMSSSAPCPAGAGSNRLNAKLTGPNITGALIILATTTQGYSESTPMTVGVGNTIRNEATLAGVSALNGDYELSLNCVTFTGAVKNSFTTTMTFVGTDVENATYTTAAPPAIDTTTTLVASPPSPQLQGTSVTLDATVAPSAAGGTVQFKDGTSNIGSAVTVVGGVASTTTSSLPTGARNLTAVFTPTNSAAYNQSTSNTVVYTIQAPPTTTTTTLTANLPSPQDEGTNVTFTATLNPSGAVGSVQFKNGGADLGGPVAVAGGTAQFSTSALPVGTNAITADFTPTNPANFTASTSSALNYTINSVATPTTTTLSIDPASPQEANTGLDYTVNVAPSAADGTIVLQANGVAFTSPQPISGGAVVISSAAQPIGTNSVVAVFTPTDPGTYAPSQSAPQNYVIEAIPTATTLTADPASPQEAGTSVTLTATVISAVNAPEGTIVFKNGASTIGTEMVMSGSASITLSDLPVGTNSLTAEFAPALGTPWGVSSSAPQDYVITGIATSTSVAASPAGSVDFGTNVTLTATVSPVDATGTVQFKDNGVNIGTPVNVAGGTAATSTTALGVGSRTITAEFTPTNPAGFTSSTGNASLTVNQVNTTTSLATNPPGPVNFGTNVTLTATVTPSNAAGTVQFKNGGTNIGAPVNVAGGTAATSTSTLPVGSNNLTAEFTPTNPAGFTSSTGNASLTVNQAATTTTLTVDDALVIEPDATVLTVTVDPAAATGTLKILDGAEEVDSITGFSGTDDIEIIADPGTYSFTAQFTPDSAGYAGSTSAAVDVTVAVAAIAFDADGNELDQNPELEPGQEVEVLADLFGENEEGIGVTLNSTPRDLGTTSADGEGVVAYAFTVPTDLEPGAHTLVFEGEGNTAVFAFTAADPATTDPGTTDPGTTDPGTTDPGAVDAGNLGTGGNGDLASTGADVTRYALLGIAMLLAGALAVRMSRRTATERS